MAQIWRFLMVKNRYFYIHDTRSFKVSSDATIDETVSATARHIVACSASGKKCD
jgi:hypothetical protein